MSKGPSEEFTRYTSPYYDQHKMRPATGDAPAGKSPQRVIQRPRIPDPTWIPSLERCQLEQRPIGHVLTALLDAWLAGEIDV